MKNIAIVYSNRPPVDVLLSGKLEVQKCTLDVHCSSALEFSPSFI
ncbi:hypothetical protein [Treponema putidum]